MKAIIPLLVFASFAVAQEIESVTQERTIEIGRKLLTTLGTPADAPIATDVDPEKASALKSGMAGVLVMPDKKLTAETLAATGKEPIAVGQLWMRLVVPAVEKAAPSPDKLRTVTVRDSENEAQVEVYFLSAAKTEAGAVELSLFGKDKTALLKVPLTKTDAPANTTPIALTAQKETEGTGNLVLTIFGTYKADVLVTKPRE